MEVKSEARLDAATRDGIWLRGSARGKMRVGFNVDQAFAALLSSHSRTFARKRKSETEEMSVVFQASCAKAHKNSAICCRETIEWE